MPLPLTIQLDGSADPRIRVDQMAVLEDGSTWDLLQGTACFVEFVANTGMLLPAPAGSAWQTSGAGIYARHRKSDYLLTTPDNWVEHTLRHTSDYFLHRQGTVAETVFTGAVYPKNQPWFLSWFSFNTGNDDIVEMECGYGGVAVDWSFRFFSSGKVQVYDGATLAGEGNIVDDKVYYPSHYGAQVYSKSGKGRTLGLERVEVYIIPYRHHEILIMSNQGGGFNWNIDRIDPDDPDPQITTPGRFFWYQPGQAQVQLAPIHFAGSAFLLGPERSLRYPPPAGGTAVCTLFSDGPGYGSCSGSARLMMADGTTPFVGDGTITACRVRVDMTGDSSCSPWVYGAKALFAGSPAYTAGSAIDITSYVISAEQPSLSVPDHPADVRLSFACKNPTALGAVVPKVEILANRPVKALVGTIEIFTGRTEAPSKEFAIGDDSSRLRIEARDRWKAFEKYLFQDPVPLDGMNLGSAFAYLAQLPFGGSATLDIDTIDFDLPQVRAASQGEYALLPEVGDTCADWLLRLWEDYAQTYYIGFKPGTAGPVFFVKGTATLGTTPLGTIWPTMAGAGGTVELVYRSYDEQWIEPEANDIWVTGLNPRTKQVVQAHYASTASQDPTLAPASRPNNWLGEIRRYGLVDPAITDQETANWGAAVLADRLTPGRKLVEWTSHLLLKSDGVPVWRGDPWSLGGTATVRITSFEGVHDVEHAAADGTVVWREYNYLAEVINP